ncbi:PAS domain-containing protein, partial [Salinibacter ruber]|uniref:PAS domain-containing protein n=1 Tax=Salinibacter ruber TaxID=146919 RepID=UPI00207450BA
MSTVGAVGGLLVGWAVSQIRRSERRQKNETERKLHKSRERLQMAVEGGNIGTWDWDLETGKVIFNRQWAEMLGYSREELDFHFSTWEELVHPVDLERALSMLDRYIEGEVGTYDPEIRMRTKSGDW